MRSLILAENQGCGNEYVKDHQKGGEKVFVGKRQTAGVVCWCGKPFLGAGKEKRKAQ